MFRIRLAFVLALLGTVTVGAQDLTLSRYAGTFWYGSDDGSGSNARFHLPSAIAVDGSGNVFVADTGNNTIRRVSPAGEVSTVAGVPGVSGASDGPASVATFSSPAGIAVAAGGDIWVSDTGNDTIRRISPAGVVTTFAGAPGQAGASDGVGAAAHFFSPSGIAVDATGNLYVADTWNDTIRKIAPDGTVTTLAGSAGVFGAADGTGAAASFAQPEAVAVDSAGDVFVADTASYTVRRVSPDGTVSTLAGAAWVAGADDGIGAAARFYLPYGIAVDGSGNLFVADTYNRTIRRVAPDGTVTTIAGVPGSSGSADGPPSAARLGAVMGVALDASESLLLADSGANEVRRMAPDGAISTIAGAPKGAGEYGTRNPAGLAVDALGNLFVAETGDETIREISPSRTEKVVAGSSGVTGSADGNGSAASFSSPSALAFDASGNLWVCDSGNATIRRITPAGDVTTLAGLAGSTGGDDGTGPAARFNFPQGIAIDAGGDAWVADGGNCTIRKVTPTGAVITVAGIAGSCGYADGVGSAARFNQPNSVAIGPDGAIYVGDSLNQVVRKVDPSSGAVTTLAGGAFSFAGGAVDGHGSGAGFALIQGVAASPQGFLFVTENDGLIRRVTFDGTVTTVAGDVTIASEREGTGRDALLFSPGGIASDASGTLFVSDSPGAIFRAVPAIPDAATIDAPTGLAGQARQLGTTAATASSWSWRVAERPAGSSAALSSSSIASPTFVPDVEGRYVFVLVASSSAGSRISRVDLFVSCTDSPAPPIALAGGTVPVCPGGSVTLSAGSAWNSFLWSTGETTATITVSPAAMATYTVVGYAADCTGPAATYTVPVLPALQSSSASIVGASSVCPDSSGGTASVTDFGGSGVLHQWGYRTEPGGSIHPISGATGATYVLNGADVPVGAGNPFYLVCVSTSACGESVVSNDVAGSVNSAPDATITAPPALCPNGGGTASVPDAGAGASYTWTVSGGHVVSGAGTRSVDFVLDGSSPATIGVTIAPASGCAATGSATVGVSNPPSAAVTATSTVCGASGVGSASVPDAGAGAMYSWSLTSGSILSGAGTRSITFTPNSGSGTVVTAVVTSPAGCQASGGASVAVDSGANAVISAPAAVCAGSGGNAASGIANPGNTYDWTISGGTITSGAGTPNVVFAAGTGSSVILGLTVRTSNGCTASSSATIPVNPLPASAVSAASSVCAGSSSTASTAAQAGATYAWTISGGTITSGQGTNAVTYTAGSSGSVALGVTVVGAGACSSSSSATVAINAPPSASITAPSSIKARQKGSASVANAGSGATYVWTVTNGTITSGNGTPSINFTAGSRGTMTLSVTVRNASGCSASGSKAITVN